MTTAPGTPALFALVGAALGCTSSQPGPAPPRSGRFPADHGHERSTSGAHTTWRLDLARLEPEAGVGPSGEQRVDLTTGTLSPERPFDELLASWNVELPEGGSVGFEVRVRADPSGAWSPWLQLGDWGDRGSSEADRGVRTEFEGGQVDVDVLRLTRPAREAQLRMRATPGSEPGGRPTLTRWTVTFSDASLLEEASPIAGPRPTPIKRVAPRSQRLARASLAERICSPTSVAMVLDYFGVARSTEAVAQRCYDPVHDLYGNWPRAVQTAWSFGVPGWLERFGEWQSVEARLAAGHVLVLSVRAAAGELRGAPYPETAGHLIVLLGFDARGDAVVNDPAADTLEGVRRTYDRHDLERCWIRRGGLAYVLGPKEPTH